MDAAIGPARVGDLGMKKGLVAVLLLLVSAPAFAQGGLTDTDLTGYTRFLVYPHVQKGLDAIDRRDRTRALDELERAHALAPESATVALHLAEAYRVFGEPARAARILREQLARAPRRADLEAALAALTSPGKSAQPVPVPATRAAIPSPGRDASAATPVPSPGPGAAAEPPAAIARTRRAAARAAAATATDRAAAPPNLRQPFEDALRAGRTGEAAQAAGNWLARDASPILLDEVSFRLMGAGGAADAVRLLARAYPFRAATPVLRDRLLQRYGLLIDERRDALDPGMRDQALTLLRPPLDTPALRSRQSAIWANLGDCDAVRAVLADGSDSYQADDWMRRGECASAGAPAVALDAFERAYALQPGGQVSRALAYQAHALGRHALALRAWRSVGAAIEGDDRLAAIEAAIDAGDAGQALLWLEPQPAAGAPASHRYWMLAAAAYTATADTRRALDALDHAVALQPAWEQYLRIGRLSAPGPRQVQALERAADLAPDSAIVRLELAYAYQRAGRGTDAREAFGAAAHLDPTSLTATLELGYARWAIGDARGAADAFERAWSIEPGNLAAAGQLVYAHQRLSHNARARWFTERVIDASTDSAGESAAVAPAAATDRLFGLRRLHEDLGRRTTVGLDGWSGSRVGTGVGAAPPGSRFTSYSQVEVDFRLGSQPVRNGTTVSAYARLFADGGIERQAFPTENARVGLGLRWKPFRQRVLFLAAEYQASTDDAFRDVLLRASASLLNGGTRSDDWHPSGGGWFAQNLYLDGAHYVEARDSAFTTDYRVSYHRKAGGGATLEPYAHAQFNGLVNGGLDRDVRAGIGVRWNLWYGATTYDAPRHKLSLGVEAQRALETYLPDRQSLLFTLASRW